METALFEKRLAGGIEKVLKKTVDLIERAMTEPGEAVGVVQRNLGEPGTQMTLRTFHLLGVKEAQCYSRTS